MRVCMCVCLCLCIALKMGGRWSYSCCFGDVVSRICSLLLISFWYNFRLAFAGHYWNSPMCFHLLSFTFSQKVQTFVG